MTGAVLAAAVAAKAERLTAANDSTVVAEVGGRTIVAGELRERLVALRTRDLQQGRLDSFAAGAPERSLQEMVDVKLLALKARQDGLDRRPDIRRRIENQVDELLAEVVVQELSEAFATEEALRAYYAAHADEFTTPGRVRARHLVVQTRAEASALLERLQANADFGELARAHNIDSTRASGGELGWVSHGVMVGPFETALFALHAGETSPIVQTSYGFHIVQAEEVEAGTLQDFAAVKESVRQKIITARIRELKQQIIAQHPVKMNRKVLEGMAK